MNRNVGLRAFSPKRLAELAAAGIPHPSTTFAKPTKLAARKPAKRPADTGPKRSVIERVDDRSGRRCEWPGCTQPQHHRHHRLNRKAGGRKREGKERVNGAAWLLGACHVHHAYVTSPSGGRRKTAERMGWLLREHQEATQVPVQTRHDPEPVWLDNDGRWHPYEEGAT
jgi:hypothetical protein